MTEPSPQSAGPSTNPRRALAVVRREGAVLAFYLFAALVLTWPLCASPGAVNGTRADYSFGLWNAWWFGQCVAELRSPYFADLLYSPEGVSLARAPLSPLNALAGALLQRSMSPDSAYAVLILLHLTLSGWTLFLLARHETGSVRGSLVGGLLYAFSPFHLYYLCQINVFSFGFVPLAVLFAVRSYRQASRTNVVGLTLSLGLVAATSSYFALYTVMFLVLLGVMGRWYAPDVPWRGGIARLGRAAIPAGIAVGLIFLPLIVETLGSEGTSGVQVERSNDLLGFNWYGPPETVRVAWPAMLGYSACALLILGRRVLIRQRFWVLLAVIFLVLSLGPELRIGGSGTGVPLPYLALAEVPIASLARKPDRFFLVTLLSSALLLAHCWKHVETRFTTARLRAGATVIALAVVGMELSAIPLARFRRDTSPFFREIARDDSVETLLELPPGHCEFVEREGASLRVDDRPPVHFVAAARHNLHQIVHGKKIATAYATFLPVEDAQERLVERLVVGYPRFLWGRSDDLITAIRELGVDVVVQNKTYVGWRDNDPLVEDGWTWRPFFLSGSDLVRIRQLGPYRERPLPASILQRTRALLLRALGPPIYEDDALVAYRVVRQR